MNITKVAKYITDLMARKWYGKLTLSIEAGKITLIKHEETIREL